MLLEKIEIFVPMLIKEISGFYKDRLISLVLFGSVARKKFTETSDIDVLIIVSALPNNRFARNIEFLEVENSLKKNLNHLGLRQMEISPILKTKEEVQIGSPLFIDMIEDAIILFDRHNFFFSILKNLQNRLKQLGAERIWRGNSWHWKLKSNYQFGEEFYIL
ncbi:MAG: nucleotidyltransferase family protein [Leptonema sp. (in: bacteria)]